MVNVSKWKMFLALAVCFFAIFQSVPNFLSEETRAKYNFLPQNTVKLGLDLQGGVHLLIQVDFDSYLKEHLELITRDVKSSLWKADRIGYTNFKAIENGFNFTLRDSARIDNTEEVAKDVSNDFTFDSTSDGNITLTYSDDVLEQMKKDVLSKSIETLRRRVDPDGTTEPIIQRQGDDRILLQVPGLKDSEDLKDRIGTIAKMNFHLMDPEDPYAVTTTRASKGKVILSDMNPDSTRKYVVIKNPVISGETLVDSRPTFDQGQPVVSFKFNNQGSKTFARITTENTGKPFAVVLDGKVITAPRINGPILGGSGIITGSFSSKETTELAILLRSGALPAPLEIIEERSVGPSLGKDSIASGKNAALIGFALVIVTMVIVYKLFGTFAAIALVINMFLVLAILSLFNATLTMPGIAGLVLTMGMAVDANVLIMERIRDELRNGKSPIAAIDAGFGSAFVTILDSNFTTLIAAFLLFSYGSGPVKGFAVTLSAGIISSMFSAITLTRFMIIFWLRKNKPKTLKI